MSQFAIAMTGGGLALLLSLLLPFVIRPLLVRLGIMDIPSERSSHERPVLRGLGLAALIAILGGGSVAAALYAIGYPAFSGWRTLIVILVASLIAGLLGLGEDLKGVSVAVRSVGLLAHAMEQINTCKVIRPRGRYIGPDLNVPVNGRN